MNVWILVTEPMVGALALSLEGHLLPQLSMTTLVALLPSYDYDTRHRWWTMPYKIDRQLAEFGAHVRGWRMVLGLTAQQVAERADISRDTLRKIENGNPSVNFNHVAQVLRSLGQLDQVVAAVDPLASDIGRLRAGNLNKRRAR